MLNKMLTKVSHSDVTFFHTFFQVIRRDEEEDDHVSYM